MNWDAIQAIAELSAAFGVLLSLVYVGIQIRQNTASLRAGAVARSSELLSQLRSSLWRDPDVANLWDQALSGAEIEDRARGIRLRHFMVALARDHEAVFYQHRAGQLPEEIWKGWVVEMQTVWCTPGGADAISGMKVLLSRPFSEFLEEQITSCAEPPLLLIRSRWEEAAMKRRQASDRDPASEA
jgi:hypothetical protein